jgi:large subunit ribosomal protein L25
VERPTLTVTSRATTGSVEARRMRLAGQVPGVLYGKSIKPSSVTVNRRELVRFLHAHVGEHGLLTLKLEADGKSTGKPVLIKRVEIHPVTGEVMHIDFHAIALTEQIRIKIPVVLAGEPVGVKQDGGLLEHFLREVEIECLPTQIPKQIDHDISALKIGDTVHVKDLAAPEGSRITADPDAGVASVLVPKVEKPTEAEAEAAAAEPEVIREKKPEEGEAAEGKDVKAEKKEEKKEDKK